MTVADSLRYAAQTLKEAKIETARLDAQLLLGSILERSKAWLLANPNHLITSPQLSLLYDQLRKRAAHMPIAYILGSQEFYGRKFRVSPAVLIPRPETEMLIDLLLGLPRSPQDTLIDIGTGSGAIAITAKLERPDMQVTATDISQTALAVAIKNAALLGAHGIQFATQSLLDGKMRGPFTFIAANLPYLYTDQTRSTSTNYEPAEALFAADDGLALIKILIRQARHSLSRDGYLLLESEPSQQPTISACGADMGLQTLQVSGFCMVLGR